MKNFEGYNIIIKFIPIIFIYEIFIILIYLKDFEIKNIMATIKGIIAAFKLRKDIHTKRKIIQKNRIITDAKLYEIGIIASISDSFEEFLKIYFKNSSKLSF